MGNDAAGVRRADPLVCRYAIGTEDVLRCLKLSGPRRLKRRAEGVAGRGGGKETACGGETRALGRPPRCLVPHFDGAFLLHESKDALWARFFTGAPRRLRRSVERYSIVKRA